MMAQPVTRIAVADDIPSLLDLYWHLNPDDERPTVEAACQALALMHHYPGSGVLLAELDGEPVSSCTLIVIPNLMRAARPYGLIENVVTHAGFRNRGFGKQVLQAAVERAFAANCYKVMLMTGSQKPQVLKFYEAAGFEQTKTGFQIRSLPVRKE